MNVTRKDVENGIYGLIAGDALGVPYEFKSREAIKKSPCVDMVGVPIHGAAVGVWSDLATMNGLTRFPREGYRPIMDNFIAWLDRGEYSVDGAFDVGHCCFDAISAYRAGVPPEQCGGKGEYSNGNGSLMRILPACLYEIALNGGEEKKIVDGVCSLTHAHPVSLAACRIYTDVVKGILSKKDKKELLPVSQIYGRGEYDRLTDKTFYTVPESEIKSGGYVVESLEAALWCFDTTQSYRECVLKAVNLGDDADTTAAIAGGLAGLYYGKESIPAHWLEMLGGKSVIERTVDEFCACLMK